MKHYSIVRDKQYKYKWGPEIVKNSKKTKHISLEIGISLNYFKLDPHKATQNLISMQES